MIFGSDDFFGGVFDFDGDGRTDLFEAYLGLQILEEMRREDEQGEDAETEQENDQ